MTEFQKRVASAMREYQTSREIADALNANETRVSRAMDKIDNMKPFQPKTEEQQRKNYIKACRQRVTAEIKALTNLHQQEHDIHARLYFNRCRIVEKIGKIEDRVADAADEEFGGWDKWRHDDALARLVVARMDRQTAILRKEIKRIDERMEAVMRPYHAECQAVTDKYNKLIKTA